MARAFVLRFKGREPEVIEQIKFLGLRKFCRQEFGDEKKGHALQKWLREQPGHEHDSIYSYISRSDTVSQLPLIKQCALAINKERRQHAEEVARHEARHEEDQREIKRLEELLRYYTFQEWSDKDIKALYDVCIGNIRGDPVEI